MRFGINTFLFTSPFTTDSVKLFPKFKKWGFESIEIPVEAPEHIDPAKVKAAADKHGLVIGSICAAMGPGRDFRGTPEEQKTATDYITALIDQAVVLGCPSIIGPIYSVVGRIGSHTDASSASSASPRLSVAISRRKWCRRLFWSANWAPAVVRGGGSGIDPSAGVPITSSDSVTHARQCCPLRWPTTLPSALSVSVHWFAFSHRKAW